MNKTLDKINKTENGKRKEITLQIGPLVVMWGTSYRRGPRGQEQPTAASGKAQAGQES